MHLHDITHAVRAAAAPALLLAAAATGTAQAAGGDFQFMGQDDRVHAITVPEGCAEAGKAGGGGSRAVVNHTAKRAVLYREPGCQGDPVAVVEPGASRPVGPYFGSVRFTV
ncbi:hypothetical protein [Streptomyces bambusae]|uniref:Secreted protein n=1 Tax=Streptomyces bambusae TaxID=1550616 RepID=A0ABS6ZET2_9ACTN|nr:hypothetical protein [Streptomyces bambusae]MBW5486259.1 hypothetical protein [Streptomyces bambusae]